MRILLGLLWALGGAVAGTVAGLLVAMVVVKVGDITSREGAAGYAATAIAIIGTVAGVVLYGRSAPAGLGVAFSGSAVLGVAGLATVIALGLWSFMNLREAPLEYDGAMANLELELRVKSGDAPEGSASRWMDIEVQTARTRPVGTVLTSSIRTEGDHLIIPVVQGPLYRAGQRVIVVRVDGRQHEVFMPTMKRTPDPKAGWSPWERPQRIDPPYGVTPTAAMESMVELRYRVRVYGE